MMFGKKKAPILGWLLLLLALPVVASEGQEELALLALLDSQTELATRSKMNADFVPGMVSVMHGDDLRTLGARNAGEALNRVAGLQVTEGNRGDYRIQVRGVGTTLAGTNVKILLNGLPMNSAVSGQADTVLRIPIEHIERLEVVRGPGSATYGEFAMTAVVNVITRRDDNEVGIKGGDAGVVQGDALAHGGQRWFANVSAWQRDDTDRISGPDNFAARPNGPPLGHSPGPVHDELAGYMLLGGYDVQGYQLSFQALQQERGDFFGRNGLADIEPDPAREQLLGVALDKRWQLAPQTELVLSASALQTDYRSSESLTVPAGITPPGGPPILQDNYRVDGHASRQYQADLHLNSVLGKSHSLLWGLGYSDQRITDSSGKLTSPQQPTHYFSADEMLVEDGHRRHVVSAYVQDQWALTERLSLTSGARYDHYDDWGEEVSPRFAAVWRLSDAHILKAQYAQAFRPPTLQESYPGANAFPGGVTQQELTAENLASSEISYIFRKGGSVVRATVFHSRLNDLIEFFQDPGQRPSYRNLGEIQSWGSELEWEQYLSRNWRLLSNVSYVDAEDSDTNRPVVGSTHWLGNLGLSWDVTPAVSAGWLLRYVGKREGWGDRVRAPQDDDFDAYTTLDMTLTWQRPAGLAGVSLEAGVNNLLNERYAFVPNPAQHPEGLTNEPRLWWLAARYRFGGP
jgi:outer membrane receptor for ferrienterochelin and colicin